MIWKLLLVAQKSWRALNAHRLARDAYDGKRFKDGIAVRTKIEPTRKAAGIFSPADWQDLAQCGLVPMYQFYLDWINRCYRSIGYIVDITRNDVVFERVGDSTTRYAQSSHVIGNDGIVQP